MRPVDNFFFFLETHHRIITGVIQAHKARQDVVSSGFFKSFDFAAVSNVTYQDTFSWQWQQHGGGHAPQRWRAA